MKTTQRELKPYDFVRVDMEEACQNWSYIGQVISRPVGDGTIMVRRVPDDSSTMESMPLEKVRLATYKPKYVHYAVITGRGRFPVDMLRYDSAAPVNFKLVTKGEPGWEYIEAELNEGETELIVAHATQKKTAWWTPARWASFSWAIRPLKTLAIVGQ